MKPQACSEDLCGNRSLNRQNHVHPPLSPWSADPLPGAAPAQSGSRGGPPPQPPHHL